MADSVNNVVTDLLFTPSEYYLAAIGEVKRGRDSDCFDAAESWAVVSLLVDLVRIDEQLRRFGIGFITDGRIIQFWKVELQEKEPVGVCSPVLYLATEGGVWLYSLFACSSVGVVGRVAPIIAVAEEPLCIDTLLGEGGSSWVWKGVYKNNCVAVKIFKPGQQSEFIAELKNLLFIKGSLSVFVMLEVSLTFGQKNLPRSCL
jgi:hypothetical protein